MNHLDQVKAIIDEADYLLEAQKKMLKDDLDDQIEPGGARHAEDFIKDFLREALDIQDVDLTPLDISKIEIWAGKQWKHG